MPGQLFVIQESVHLQSIGGSTIRLSLLKNKIVVKNILLSRGIRGHYLYVSGYTGDGTAILRGHPNHAKVWLSAGQRKYTFIFQLFYTPEQWSGPGVRTDALTPCSQALCLAARSKGSFGALSRRLLRQMADFKREKLVHHFESRNCTQFDT